ncbi:carbonic anhydrase [Azohydromonas aeria]|uniref:carbonic anhydrase n=1 Tax=Azohydromonas aeria TaxID=2590212 RepID=UPI0012FADF34|nr:carbonic anhydrase [Azohydromonas aeria]
MTNSPRTRPPAAVPAPLPLSRRGFFRRACACCGVAALPALPTLPARAAEGRRTSLTAAQALERLKQGNANFLADRLPPDPPDHASRRLELARSQTPFAVLVSCSDSRVPPELLFGAGLGELFIVRNAGNTVDTVALGSIQYAVQVLGAPLILVMGHERCGAVDAAVSVVQKNATFPGSIGQMIEPIIPAVLKARSAGGKDDELLDLAVRENVRRTVLRLRESEPSLIEPQRGGRLRVVGARYDLDDGKVDFFVE